MNPHRSLQGRRFIEADSFGKTPPDQDSPTRQRAGTPRGAPAFLLPPALGGRPACEGQAPTFTSICFGLASSALGTVTVRTPSL